MTSLCTLFVLVLITGTVLAQDRPIPSVANTALRMELLKRAEQDQIIRRELIAKGMQRIAEEDSARVRAVDADNTARMKAIVQQHGWPGPELVGKDGSEAAFLLVQHADHAFQKEFRDKELVPDPIEDELNVDRRRAELGLPALAEYLEFAKRMYFPENKPE